MKKQKLTSGEIARICNINKKTLFYYDQIDLLKPAIVESNGYRYYTLDQIDILSKIRALQSVGFTLLEIKKQLSVDNIATGIETLSQQHCKIEKKINELVTVKEALNQKILELEHYKLVGDHQVFLQDYDEERLSLDETLSQEEIITNYIVDGYHSGVILKNLDDSNKRIKISKYRKVGDSELANYRKERGKYVGVYFLTKEKDIIDGALKALSIIKNSEYSTIGIAYLKDVAADFVNIRDGYMPFLITMKLEDDI